MLNYSFSPILISVYSREVHFVRLIESLKRNAESPYTILYVISDAPRFESDIENINKIREFTRSLDGFSKVILLEMKKNSGSQKTILTGIMEVFKYHDKLIFLEDDNYVSENFLSFMNKALDNYYSDERIFSISGYNYPINIPNEYDLPVYIYKGFSAWGVGLWKKRWLEISWDINNMSLKKDIEKNKKVIMKELGDRVGLTIEHMTVNETMYIDAYVCYYLYKKNKYSIFPTLSKVRNLGHDGLGEHGGNSDIFINQEIDNGKDKIILPSSLPINEEINKKLYDYFKLPTKTRVKLKLKNFLNYKL